MKVLVLFRSYHGNTRQVAEAIGRRLTELGHQALVQDVRQRLPDLASIDAVFNGAPTRFARVNRRSVAILRALRRRGFGSKPVAIYDTCAVLPTSPAEMEQSRRWLIPGAVGIMHKAASDLGLNVYPDTLRCEVRELNGPLADGAIQKALAFTDAFVASVAPKK